jgi:putative FmdB family regulatory protein
MQRLRAGGTPAVPLYAYKCVKCGHEFEKIEKLDAPHRQKCPKCKGRAERQLTAPAIQFKGAGWYVTDYARSGGGGEKKETGESVESSKDSKEAKEIKAEKPKKEKKGKEK